ncbi:MAG: hypothetical protein K1X92_08975 [Bacteroidia bacterium]|nr:hypothetical protein [Bacteroidia bacterium]
MDAERGTPIPSFDPLPEYQKQTVDYGLSLSPGMVKAWSMIQFPAGSYKIGDKVYNYETLYLPEATFVEASRQKNIVETAVAGRRGKVKEIISSEDWEISIKGIITTGSMGEKPTLNPDEYPHNEVMALRNFTEIDKDVEILGELFTTLGIQRVVVKSIAFPLLEGFPFLQPYVLECVSDFPFELEVALDNQTVALARDFQNYG